MHRNWLKLRSPPARSCSTSSWDKAADTAVGSVYYRDVDHTFNSAEYGIFIGEESARGKGLWNRDCPPVHRFPASPRCTCTASVCACLPRTPLPAAATPLPALWRKAPSVTWSVWTASTAMWSLWQKLHNNVQKQTENTCMDKLKRLLKKTPLVPFGIAGRVAVSAAVLHAGVPPRCGRRGCRPISITTK